MNEEREHGTQPLDRMMTAWGLGNHDLVEASPEQLNHKQVQRARSGRRLTLKMMMKMARSLNIAIWNRLKADEREKFVEYLHKDLRGYFLRFNLRCLRKDRDGTATASGLLGDRIRVRRRLLELTQRQVAALVGVTPGTFLSWEKNQRRPSSRKLAVLAAALGVA